MKKYLVIIPFIFILISPASASDWVLTIFLPDGSIGYIDKDSIKKTKKNTVRVMTKTGLSSDVRVHYAQTIGPQFFNVYYVIDDYEALCGKRALNVYSRIFFNGDDQVIEKQQRIDGKPAVLKVIPGTSAEILYDLLCDNWGNDWEYYFKDRNGSSYFDKSSIKQISKGVRQVRTKMDVSPEYARERAKEKDRYAGLKYNISLDQYDCNQNKFKKIVFRPYNDSDVLLDIYPPDEEWHKIEPDSSGEALMQIICGNRKTKK